MTEPITRTDLSSPLHQAVPAGSTPVYTGQFEDEAGLAVGAGDLTAVTLTLVDTDTGAIVNAVDNTNIFNSGRGTVDAQGNLEIVLTAQDTALAAGLLKATRSLIVKWSWGTNRSGLHQVDFRIVALSG